MQEYQHQIEKPYAKEFSLADQTQTSKQPSEKFDVVRALEEAESVHRLKQMAKNQQHARVNVTKEETFSNIDFLGDVQLS